jgi:hypothetical protein
MLASTTAPLDRFAVLRDGHTVSLAPDRRKAEQIARHFKRLQPTSTVVVKDLTTERAAEV